MEIGRNKILIILIILILIIAFFLLQPQIINQQFSTSKAIITKNILLFPERKETYTISSENPTIGFLIVPKSLASNWTQLKFEGDFYLNVLAEDPVIELTPNELGPGTKTFTISGIDANLEQTTILFTVPLKEYLEMSESEKTQIKELIINYNSIPSENFTIEHSKEIMNSFNGSLGNIGLEEKKIKEGRISFAEAPNIFSTLMNALNTTPIKQNGETFLGPQSLPTVGDEFNITLTMKPEEQNNGLPKEIVLQYSKKTPVIMWNGIIEIDEESEINEGTELVLKGPENFKLEYNRLDENASKKIKYLITISINTENYPELGEIEEKIVIKHNVIFAKENPTTITLINNPCNEFPQQYQKTINEVNAEYKRDLARIQAISCIGDKTPEQLAQLLETYDTTFKENIEISESKIVGSLNYYPQLYDGLRQIKEENKRQNFLDYESANNGLKNFVNNYNSILEEALYQLKEIKNNTKNADVLDLANFFEKKFELLKSESSLWLDPTKPTNIENTVERNVEFLATLDPELTMASQKWIDEKEKLQKQYEDEYGNWKIKTYPTIRAIHISEINSDLNDLEREVAKLFLDRGIGFDTLDTKYYINQSYFNVDLLFTDIKSQDLQSSKLLREIIHLLATKGFSDKDYTLQLNEAIRKFRIEIGRTNKNSEETINNFEFPQTSTWSTFWDNASVRLNAAEFQARRGMLRKEIEQKTKEKVGLILITQRIYDSSFTDTYKGKELRNSGTTKYDQINFINGQNSLLEIYETIAKENKDRNLISSWLENSSEEKIDLAIECLEAAFDGPLHHEIELIKHMKFKSFIHNDISKAEEFEAEIALVQNVIDNEDLLITKAIVEAQEEVGEDQARKFENLWGFNHTVFNAFKTGLWLNVGESTEDLEEKFSVVKGANEIKKQLYSGKTLLEVYEQNDDSIIAKIGKRPELYTNTINGNLGGEHGSVSSNYSNQELIDIWDSKFDKLVEKDVQIAFTNTILKTEIEKQQLIKTNSKKYENELKNKTPFEKRELLIPKEVEAGFSLEIANYYRDEKLYDVALENYLTIMNEFPKTNTAALAEKEARNITRSKADFIPFVIFFKKRGRENTTLILKEFTSLKSIATFATTYAFVKVVAVPRLLQMKGAQTAIQNQAARKIMVQELFKRTATSPEGMKLAMENINLRLLTNSGGAQRIASPLTKASRIQQIWSKTRKGLKTITTSIRNTKTYKVLTHDLLSTQAYRDRMQEYFVRGYTAQVRSELEAYANAKGIVNGVSLNLTDVEYARRAKGFAQILLEDRIITHKGYERLVSQADDLIAQAEKADDLMNSLAIETSDSTAVTFSKIKETYAIRQMANVSAVDLAKSSSGSSLIFGGNIEEEISALATVSEALFTERVVDFAKLERTNIELEKIVLEQQMKNYEELGVDNPYVREMLENKLTQLDIDDALRTPIEVETASIKCSTCKFEIEVDSDELGQFAYLPRPKLTQDLISINADKLSLSSVTIGGEPATQIIVDNQLLEGMMHPIISLDKLGKGTIKISVLSKNPFVITSKTGIPITYSSQTNIGYSFGKGDSINALVEKTYGFSLDELRSISAYSVKYNGEEITFPRWGDGRDIQAKFFEGLAITQNEHSMLEIRPSPSAGEVVIDGKTISISNPLVIGPNQLPLNTTVNGAPLIIEAQNLDAASHLDYGKMEHGAEIKKILEDPLQRTVYIGSSGYWERIKEAHNWPFGISAFFSRRTGVTFIGPNLLIDSIEHEQIHRAIWFMSPEDKQMVLNTLLQNPNWEKMRSELIRIHPKYADESAADNAEELLAFNRENQKYPELFKITQSKDLATLLDTYVNPLVTPVIDAVFVRGEQNFFEAVKSGAIGAEAEIRVPQTKIALNNSNTVTMQECANGCVVEAKANLITASKSPTDILTQQTTTQTVEIPFNKIPLASESSLKKTLSREDLPFADAEMGYFDGLLKNPPGPTSYPDPREDYARIMQFAKEKKYGVDISTGTLRLNPIPLSEISFDASKRYFIHGSSTLGIITNPDPNRFGYVGIGGSHVEHGWSGSGVMYEIEIDPDILSKYTSVYLDPESLEGVNSVELGKSFIIKGGIPKEAVIRIRKITNPDEYYPDLVEQTTQGITVEMERVESITIAPMLAEQTETVVVDLPNALDAVPENIINTWIVDDKKKIRFVSSKEMMAENPEVSCGAAGCLNQFTYEIFIPYDSSYYWMDPTTLEMDTAKLTMTLKHEQAHRGFYNLKQETMDLLVSDFTSRPDWKVLKEKFLQIWPEYRSYSPEVIDREITSEFISRVIGYEDFDMATIKGRLIPAKRVGGAELIMEEIAPLITDKVRATIQLGEEAFQNGIFRPKWEKPKPIVIDISCASPCTPIVTVTEPGNAIEITGNLGEISSTRAIKYSPTNAEKLLAGIDFTPEIIALEHKVSIETATAWRQTALEGLQQGKTVAIIHSIPEGQEIIIFFAKEKNIQSNEQQTARALIDETDFYAQIGNGSTTKTTLGNEITQGFSDTDKWIVSGTTRVTASDGQEFSLRTILENQPANQTTYTSRTIHGRIQLINEPISNVKAFLNFEINFFGDETIITAGSENSTAEIMDLLSDSDVDFFVSPELRTKYSGLGTMIMKISADVAQRYGATGYKLIKALETAVPLYESYGFDCELTDFIGRTYACSCTLPNPILSSSTGIERKSKFIDIIPEEQVFTTLDGRIFKETIEGQTFQSRRTILYQDIDPEYLPYLPESIMTNSPIYPIKVIGFYHEKTAHVMFVRYPKLGLGEKWPSSQAELDKHALVLLIRNVRGETLTQTEIDTLNNVLLGNADFSPEILQNSYAANILSQGGIIGIQETSSPITEQIVRNSVKLNSETRNALRQKMVDSIDPAVVYSGFNWDIKVEPEVAVLEQ